MDDNLTITKDALDELCILRSKAEVVIDCLIGDAHPREQTLAYIATDYLGEMKTMMQRMFQPLS